MMQCEKDENANETVVHGVFMRIFSTGVLITGNSGLGKSELALDLIDRGHALIADDAPLFLKDPTNPQKRIGRSDPKLYGWLAIRGLGLLNVPVLFGTKAVQNTQPLDLIIALTACENTMKQPAEPLQIQQERTTLVGLCYTQFILPITANRRLGLLIETLVKQWQLQTTPQPASTDMAWNLNLL
jgi:HPr kinase/phosphorylase